MTSVVPATWGEVVILAGGEGSRLGGDKPLALYRGQRLIDRALAAVARHASRVIVSLPATGPGDALDAALEGWRARGVTIDEILDEREERLGPLAGIEAGLAALEGDRALFLPVDLARLDTSLVRRLLEESERATRLGVVCVHDGGVEPLVAVYRKALLDEVRGRLARGDRAARGLAEVAGVVALRVVGPGERDGALRHEADRAPAEVFRSINRPEDLER